MKVFLLVAAIVVGLLGLAITGCGAVFTVLALPSGTSAWMISLPSIALGVALLFGARALWRARR